MLYELCLNQEGRSQWQGEGMGQPFKLSGEADGSENGDRHDVGAVDGRGAMCNWRSDCCHDKGGPPLGGRGQCTRLSHSNVSGYRQAQ